MATRAFRMQLKPGNEAEYLRRHDEIWPELAGLLKQSGISNYSIFHDAQSHALFALMDVAETNGLNSLPDNPIMRRWWNHMAPLMEVAADNKPLEWPLARVFHLP